MKAAKGQTQRDGTYLFTCGTCGGKAYTDKSIECAWCYGGDVARIAVELKTARGQRYYGLLKSFLRERGKAMVDAFVQIRTEAGKVTPVDIGYIALRFDLNYKATWEWLYEARCIGVDYDDVARRFKVSEVMDAARKKYPPADSEGA